MGTDIRTGIDRQIGLGRLDRNRNHTIYIDILKYIDIQTGIDRQIGMGSLDRNIKPEI